MSAPPSVLEEAATIETPAARRPGRRRTGMEVFRHYLAMPLALVVAALLLYLWVQSRSLDSIEQRLLTAEGIQRTLLRHMYLVVVSTVIVIALAVPAGILLTRRWARTIRPGVLAVANAGQAIPSFGIIVLLGVWFGFGVRYAIIALVIFAFLPILRNTMVGVSQVDPAILEAGQGMGMTRRMILWKLEMPLAVPVVLAGIRTALMINVGTATIAVLTNAGGLGQIVYSGIQLNRDTVLYAGAIMVAILALAVDYVASVAEEHLSPRGL
jgi:osmoprotectant transport system permease protein